MVEWLLSSVLVVSLAGCANHLQTVGQQLTTALAGEPVVINTQETSSGLSGLFNQSGIIRLTSSADYLYPSGGWHLRPGAPVLSKTVPIFRSFQNTTITVIGYTDNTPVGPQLQRMGISNNTDLSLKRASEAVAYYQSQGVNPICWTRKDSASRPCRAQRYARRSRQESAHRDLAQWRRHMMGHDVRLRYRQTGIGCHGQHAGHG